MLASEHGHAAVVKYLLEQGANYNVRGWGKENLYNDVLFQLTQLTEISTLCKKSNNTNFKNILDAISITSLSSHYTKYNNLVPEKIKQQFSKFKKQLQMTLLAAELRGI